MVLARAGKPTLSHKAKRNEARFSASPSGGKEPHSSEESLTLRSEPGKQATFAPTTRFQHNKNSNRRAGQTNRRKNVSITRSPWHEELEERPQLENRVLDGCPGQPHPVAGPQGPGGLGGASCGVPQEVGLVQDQVQPALCVCEKRATYQSGWSSVWLIL